MKKKLKKFVLIPFAILLTLIFIVYVVSFLSLLWPNVEKPFYVVLNSKRSVAVVSHQGGEGIRPTNTAVAFRDSFEMGVDVLDSDMHMTSDGILVLAHDETIDRVSDGSGAIRDMTYEELKKYDFGYDFTTDNGATYPYRGQGVGIMTLDELYTAYPNSIFGIEIKQTTVEAADKLCGLTKKFGYEDKLLVSAFAQKNMDRFRELCPSVATSATEGETKAFFIYHTIGLAGLHRGPFDSVQVPEYSGKTHVLTKRFISDSRAKGYAVIPWTINEESDIKRISNMGVDAINTNFPDRMIKVIESK